MGVCSSSEVSGGVSPEDIQYCQDGIASLRTDPACHSLLKDALTDDVMEEIKERKTATFGSTLKDVIQSGVENPDSGIGVYAPDAEAYSVFAPLFNPIIMAYHGGFGPEAVHPPSDFGQTDHLEDIDPDNKYIVSTRIRTGRSVEGLPFNPNMNETQYRELEDRAKEAFTKLPESHAGTYYPLAGMTDEVQDQLIEDHFLFKEGDRFLQAANASRHWPTGRGIFHNAEKTFLVWVGEEDHLRIISMAQGGDVGQVYRLLIDGISAMDSLMHFSSDPRLGWLTFCPTNLGTAIRASVHIRLPLLAKGGMDRLQEVADSWQLQVRGTSGEHSEAEGGVYDISNRERMGVTEAQAVGKMYSGVKALIQMEKELEGEGSGKGNEGDDEGHDDDHHDGHHHDHHDHDDEDNHHTHTDHHKHDEDGDHEDHEHSDHHKHKKHGKKSKHHDDE